MCIRDRDYHRLDLGMNWNLHKGDWSLDMFFQILNIYNRENVLIRNWETDEKPEPDDMGMLPLLPTFGFRAEF